MKIALFMDFIRLRIGFKLFDRIKPYNDAIDYIGPEKITKIRILKPAADWARYPFGIDFNLAGWIHDGLYEIGGDESFRQWVDGIFQEAMEWLISHFRGAVSIIQRFLARIRAKEYYKMVRFAGSTCFSYREVQ